MKRFTKEDDAYIRQHYPNSSTKAIAEHLGRSPQAIRNRAYELGAKKASKAARDRAGSWQILSEVLELLYADMHNQEIADFLGFDRRTVTNRAHHMGLSKGPKIKAELLAMRRAQMQGNRTGNFKNGHVPWNAGMRGGTMFKGGVAPHASPAGTERIRYLQKGTKQELAYVERRLEKPPRWERVHTIVWKEANGPVPPGHIIAFKPGKHTTVSAEITPDILECVTRADIARRNNPMSISPEFAVLCQLKGKITQQINRLMKEREQKNEHAAHG